MRKGRPRLILKAPAVGFALALGTGLLNTLLPLPQWVLLLIAAGAGVFLWQYTERFWPTAAAQVATHGSARWAELADLVRFKRLDQPRDFALGRAQFNTNGADSRFRYMGHVMTCAPTGSGKGIGAVIPNLLEYPGSALVLDIKGENYAVTGKAREAMGHKVYVLDPFGVTDRADAFNWLTMLDVNSPDVVAQASGLADMLVVSEKAGDHWDETAKELLRGLLVHVASLPADRAHMGELRRLITGPADELDALLVDMAASDVGYGVVARAANAFLAKADKERSGVLSSVIRHTAFLDDPRVAASLRRSSFDLARLKAERMTIFVVIPPARLAANTRYMRGFIGLAFEALTRTADKPADRVAFFLDEFAQLGYMKPIEDAVGLLRGYGVAFWFFLQDLSQLKAVYPKWQTFLANSAQQYFGTNDFDTAKYISDMLGQSTIQYSTEGHSRQDAKPLGGSSTSDSQHYHGRSLLTPDEVIRLGPLQPLVFVPGEPPYKLRRLDYLSDPAYSAKAQPNPYHG
ncbi:type IV secretory system conjugative DNA transfer family protein [Pseudomonas aeruginosa]|nr:type IV secretory system conjugative DNA transfer family protein [Pseudomonas aeruginosa]